MSPSPFQTHDVTNQSPPFEDINLYLTDAALREAVAREGGAGLEVDLAAFGATTGSARGFEIARLVNENPPRLRRFDQKGFPLDVVDYHPAYHEAMTLSCEAGLHCSPWQHLADHSDIDGASLSSKDEPMQGAHVVRAAHLYMMTQMEPGHVCPITMTNAAVATLLKQPDVATSVLGQILSLSYDPAFKPIPEKSAITIGMGMTEKQGGTDVRQNTTRAAPVSESGPGRTYNLVGHKWFMSAPMCDAFLMLAQAPGGLSCYFVPRFRSDGSVNAIRLQRLKEKLGNRSNASSEVELNGAEGLLIGEEGRGVQAIIEMVTLTRLDCAVASAGQMRLALALAVHHCRHRIVFQKRLIDQPLMTGVLADMALDVEAATALALRLARAFDGAATNEAEAAWARLMTPVTKYWVCKIAPALGYEAMECLGGNGYVEDGIAARLYRELPLNAIWEGSGNVMCLDTLRALRSNPDGARCVLGELRDLSAANRSLGAALDRLAELAEKPDRLDENGRVFTELLARTAAGAILNAHAPVWVADGFVETRLAGGFRHTYGAGRALSEAAAIVDRVFPN